MPESLPTNAGALAEVAPEDFAKLIANTPKQQIDEMVRGELRKPVLDEIFSRMADHVDPAKARGVNAVIHFKILDRPDDQGGGYDHYEVVFEDGRCAASDSPEKDPQVTIRVGAFEFLKLASNQASGPVLFMTRRLKLEGDLMLASRLISYFRIPSAA